MSKRNLNKSLKKFSNKKEERLITISGELGLPLNGQKLVEVPNRAGYVFVRLHNNTSEVIQAYNSEVSTIYGLPVLVARSNNIYKVIGRDQDRYRDWGPIPYLPKHGGQHSFNPALGMGADIVWVYSPQFMPMLGYPSGTSGGDSLIVAPHLLRDLNGNWKYVGNTGTPNITQYRPSSGAIMVLVYVDSVSGNPYLLVGSGTVFAATLTGTNDITPYIPRITDNNWIPDVAVRLTTGTTQIFWSNLYDARPFFQPTISGTLGGGGGGGGGGSSVGQIGIFVQDEGVPLGTGTVLNFVGNNVDASISGTVVRVFVTGSTGASSSCGAYPITTSPNLVGGTVYQVPDRVYASGSLAYFYNGLMQCKGTDYQELIYVSGTFQLLFTPATGSCHMVMYGVPCTTQTYLPTGTGGLNDLTDSNGVLMIDSNGIQLTDSNG